MSGKSTPNSTPEKSSDWTLPMSLTAIVHAQLASLGGHLPRHRNEATMIPPCRNVHPFQPPQTTLRISNILEIVRPRARNLVPAHPRSVNLGRSRYSSVNCRRSRMSRTHHPVLVRSHNWLVSVVGGCFYHARRIFLLGLHKHRKSITMLYVPCISLTLPRQAEKRHLRQ
jgi:hypothetical protein